MSASQRVPLPPSRPGDFTWEMAALYPRQGDWSESEYIALATNRLVEFEDGCLEFLPMPNTLHQLIVRFLFLQLHQFVASHRTGEVFFAPLPIRLRRGKYREPDVVYCRPEQMPEDHGQPHGAELAMEVVSEGEENRDRDIKIKRREYAAAKIREYWIVDPELQEITILVLEGSRYREHGRFKPGQNAASCILDGFETSVAEVFQTKKPKRRRK